MGSRLEAADIVHVPLSSGTIDSLKREFDISNNEIESFITALISKTITESTEKKNSEVFTESEAKELEEDLSGLGYI